MNKRHHELFHPASFVLSRDNYDDLCMIRDKLLLLAQLAGTNTSNGDHDFVLFIRRGLIGRLFGDLNCQLNDVLEAVAQITTSDDCAPTH